jgi:hypothetical protein
MKREMQVGAATGRSEREAQFARSALLQPGWAEDVDLTVDAAGGRSAALDHHDHHHSDHHHHDHHDHHHHDHHQP